MVNEIRTKTYSMLNDIMARGVSHSSRLLPDTSRYYGVDTKISCYRKGYANRTVITLWLRDNEHQPYRPVKRYKDTMSVNAIAQEMDAYVNMYANTRV